MTRERTVQAPPCRGALQLANSAGLAGIFSLRVYLLPLPQADIDTLVASAVPSKALMVAIEEELFTPKAVEVRNSASSRGALAL
eukprot:4398150-Pleurochrysis_carterae.AAC.2